MPNRLQTNADTDTPVTDIAVAVISQPDIAEVAAARGAHRLLMIDDDWYVLVGPDDMTDTAWVFPLIVARAGGGRRDWAVTWETFGQALVTHFTRD